MTIKFQRVKRSAPRAADRASTQSSLCHSIEEGQATYVASQLQTETRAESLQIGNQQIELLGDLHEALAHHSDRRLQQFFDYWLALASERDALPSRQAI